jgi:biopolymer transport protein ExbD
MRIRRRKRNSYGDSSASSDIAFLLIIYFIVIAGFNINKGFLMNLPAKNSTRLILKDDLMRFDMDSSGDIFYQGGVLGLQEAENLINTAVSSHPNMAVVLSIDPLSPWQRIVSFVELAQKLEINSFSFNMKEDS